MVPSLIEAVEAREVAARGRADRLREQIAGLSEELSQVEAELSRLRITRETVDEVLSDGPAAAAVPVGGYGGGGGAVDGSGGGDARCGGVRGRHGDLAGLPAVPVAFAEAEGPLRCKEVCTALGLGTQANHVEGMRSKLKRLVERHILVEIESGLFALASGRGARSAAGAGRTWPPRRPRSRSPAACSSPSPTN